MHPSPAVPSRTKGQPANPLSTLTIRVCPECAGPVAHGSGCTTCLQCGWGRCG